MSVNMGLFEQVLIGAAVVSLLTVCVRLALVRVGRPTGLDFAAAARIKDLLQYGFAQKRVVADRFGYSHLLLFWSFVVLALHHPIVAQTESIMTGSRPSGLLLPYPDGLLLPLMTAFDLLALLGLAAGLVAVVRRLAAPAYPEGRSFAFFILPLLPIAILSGYFVLNAYKIALFLPPELQPSARQWLPVSGLLAVLFQPVADKLYQVGWWLHSLAVLALVLALPYGRFMHIVTALPNILLRRREQPLLPEREAFAPGNRFGSDRIDGYTRKELLDGFACTECGRCQTACPAAATGKQLNPRLLIAALRRNLLENGSLLATGQGVATPLIGEGPCSISEEAIWDCTTCGACMQSCPVFIEQMPKLIPLRRHLVEMESKFPEELLNLFENMEGRSNPWGIAPSERGKWATQLGERPFEAGKTEYLFYVGCAGSFDARAKQVTVALALLLDKAGVSWGMLGKDEHCCGDSLRRLGNEYVFDKLASANVALFKERGITKVIAHCPHCLSTLKNDYRQYGIELEVIHHSQLLLQLVQEGRLQLNRQVAELGKLVYHDSCYLGRHNGIYDEPREALQLATGKAPTEMERSRENGFCCGAGGGRMWQEEFTGERINLNRTKEALAQQPDTVCVACPYCLTMLGDGLKDLKAEKVQVKDLAEVMAEAVLR